MGTLSVRQPTVWLVPATQAVLPEGEVIVGAKARSSTGCTVGAALTKERRPKRRTERTENKELNMMGVVKGADQRWKAM